jgi:hypothetical protein
LNINANNPPTGPRTMREPPGARTELLPTRGLDTPTGGLNIFKSASGHPTLSREDVPAQRPDLINARQTTSTSLQIKGFGASVSPAPQKLSLLERLGRPVPVATKRACEVEEQAEAPNKKHQAQAPASLAARLTVPKKPPSNGQPTLLERMRGAGVAPQQPSHPWETTGDDRVARRGRGFQRESNVPEVDLPVVQPAPATHDRSVLPLAARLDPRQPDRAAMPLAARLAPPVGKKRNELRRRG